MKTLSALVIVSAAMLFADDETRLNWNGALTTDDRVTPTSSPSVSWQEYRLALKTSAKPNDNIKVFAETWVRSLNPLLPSDTSQAGWLSDLQNPSHLSLREAYADIYGLFGNHLDLRLGRQRIAWGTADKMNPTDNLNPDDLEDMWDFGRHLPSDALKATVYAGRFAFTGVVIPKFRHATMPLGGIADALMPIPDNSTVRTILPLNSLGESANYGIKGAANVAGYDMSLSYVYARDDLPAAQAHLHLDMVTPSVILPVLDSIRLMFPRQHILGADFAGEIKSIGVWIEAALFMPEKIRNRLHNTYPFPTPDAGLAQDDKPFVKYVVGADYTFPANIYVNAQFVHGFLNERGDSIHDYIMVGVDWKIFNDKIKISPLGMGLEIRDWSEPAGEWGFAGQPEITWYAYDNVELSLGGRILEGTAGTRFGALKHHDNLYLKSRISF